MLFTHTFIQMSLKSDVLDFLSSVDLGNPRDFIFEFRDNKLNETTELALLHGACGA